MSGNSGNPPGDPGNPGNSSNLRNSGNSGNYDYPPASLWPRPPRLFDGQLSQQSFRERYPHTQDLIDTLNAQQNRSTTDTNSSPWLRLIENVGSGESTESLSELLRIPAEDHLNETRGTHREDPRPTETTRPSTRARVHYLQNLLHSARNRLNADETSRALEALDEHNLNQDRGRMDALDREIEEHNLDQIRDRNSSSEPRSEEPVSFNIPRPPQIDFASLRSSHRTLWDQVRAEFGINAQSPARTSSYQDSSRPTTSSRNLRRRAFRPDLRGSSNINDPIPIPPLMPQSSSASSGRDGRGRLKRRKLDADDNREGFRGFNYGHNGQVVPGPLKMEIASCDGGIYDPDGDSSFPDNVLRNDQSVYCTKSDRCNIVLQHRGEAPFCLKKIVIKAPRTGFDSPIQEGMVFVSMSSDELLARTAQYQIQYASHRRRRRARRSGLQPSQEYHNSVRSPLQSLDRTVLMGPGSQATSDNEHANRAANDPQADFRIITEYDEYPEDNLFMEREDEERPSVAEVEQVPDEDDFCSDSSDSISEDEDLDDNNMSNVHRRRIELQRLQSQRRRPASLVNPIPPPSSAPAGSSVSVPNFEVLKPHARFFIEREKSMVSIKFDPPPSGRFILIKLWSPRSDGNIDIQSIIAHGYAGPRFFPSGGFR